MHVYQAWVEDGSHEQQQRDPSGDAVGPASGITQLYCSKASSFLQAAARLCCAQHTGACAGFDVLRCCAAGGLCLATKPALPCVCGQHAVAVQNQLFRLCGRWQLCSCNYPAVPLEVVGCFRPAELQVHSCVYACRQQYGGWSQNSHSMGDTKPHSCAVAMVFGALRICV